MPPVHYFFIILYQSILSVHDQVRKRAYETQLPAFDPHFHPQTRSARKGNGPDVRTVGLHKSSNEPLVSSLSLFSMFFS